MNNMLVNTYWEARLPSNYAKPGQNAPSSEVCQFITDKYIKKRWVDTGMRMDPASLFAQDRKKFDKYKAEVMSGQFKGGKKEQSEDEEEEEDSEEEKERRRRRKEKKEKKKASKKHESQSKGLQKPLTSAKVDDFISFESTPMPKQ